MRLDNLNLADVWDRFTSESTEFGLGLSLRFLLESVAQRLFNGLEPSRKPKRTLRLSAYDRLMHYRSGSTDWIVIRDLLFRQAYAACSELIDIRFVVDCGANIGCASLYFLEKYPKAHVVAVEPDKSNFEMCKANLRGYFKRVTLYNAAIWPECARLNFDIPVLGPVDEWAVSVRPAIELDRSDVRGLDLQHILHEAQAQKIDLLKIDIEGAELAMFSRNWRPWLDLTRNLVIELHGSEAENAFYQTMAHYECEMSRVGEYVLCRNISPK